MGDVSHGADGIVALNAAVHARLDESFLRFLESLTALELRDARTWWASFCGLLDRHATLEEAKVFPLYADHPDPPRGGALEIFEGEHRNLERLTARAELALARIEAAGDRARRELVTSLDDFLRVRHVLDHHSEREERFMYPWVAEQAPVAVQEGIAFELAGQLRAV